MDEVLLRNRYRVVEQLGSGGAGSVFAVDDLRRVGGAVRLALKAQFVDPQQRELLSLLRREFRVLATLRHPWIARVYDFGRLPSDSGLSGADGRPGYFYTRDLVDGVDLSHYCQDLPLLEICIAARRTAEVLDALHRAGMVHRDFKPANVIVARDGQPHLIDFGLAQGEGHAGHASGTTPYLSPELLRGKKIDRRADLYALGITLYQLVTGRLPLERDAPLTGWISWHLEAEPLSLAPDQGPAALGQLIQRLTQRDRDRRYPAAGEVALALDEVIAELGGTGDQTARRGRFVAPAPGESLNEPLATVEERVRRRAQKKEAPALTAVVGDPGSGKSTLLRELTWRCQLAGIEALVGEFLAGDPRPYGPLFDLLDQLAGLIGAPHPLRAQRVPAGAASPADRYGFYQQITDYLRQAATRVPVVLIFDGLEQADDESRAAIRFISHTLDRSDRLALIVAFADDPTLDAQLGRPQRVELQPLSVAEISRMLADASGRPDETLAEQIVRRTGGSPLFVVEVLRRLAEADWPTAPDLEQLALPRGLEEMHGRRWEELDDAEREVLALLAVLGRPTSGLTLLRIAQALEQHAKEATVGLPLESLEARGWLVRQPDGAWTFRQGPAAQFVYDALPTQQRQALHRSAAQASKGVERTRHALAAGDLRGAWPGLEQALELLRGLGSHRQAIALCQQALTLSPDVDQRRYLRRELGELYRLVGNYEGAGEQLERALEGARGRQRVLCEIALARVHVAAGDAESALATADRLLSQDLDRELAEQLATLRVAALAIVDDHEAVLDAVDRTLAAPAPAAVDPATRAELLGRKGWALGQLSRYDSALKTLAAALDDARLADDPRTEANILNRTAVIAQRRGDAPQVAERYEQALQRAHAASDPERVATIRFNLASSQLQRGRYAACLEHLQQSLRLFEAMGAEQSAAAARCNLGFVELKVGLYEQARVTLATAIEQTGRLGLRSGEALARLLAALVAARRGRFDEAREQNERARRIYHELGQDRDAADALLDVAEIEWLDKRPHEALQTLERVETSVDLDELAELWIRHRILRAQALAAAGSAAAQQTAQVELDEAAERARQLDSPELSWQCHAAAMLLADALGERARAGRQAAAGVAILEQMARGLPPDLQAAFWQEPGRQALRHRAAGARAPSISPAKKVPMSTLPPEEFDATLPASALSGNTVQAVRERFYRLLEIYRRINAELDPERLLGLVMDTAVELTGAERGFLLLGEEPSRLEVKIARKLNPQHESSAYSRSIAEQVASSGQPVITVSAHSDPRFSEFASVHQMQLESVLCIPIYTQDRVTGVLYMESRFQSGRFTPEDQRLLMAFGDQVAIALTNAQLVADNLRKARELERAKREIEKLAEERGRRLSERTAQLRAAERDLAETRRRLQSQTGKFGIVGASAPMLRIFELIERVARADIPVLIEGESGTGKEMVARAIHDNSSRRKRRMVSVNCAAIPETLLESELFGHVRGAFTGADRERRGLFAAADGGTLFLDEIGDMPQRMQVDLLRALQEKTIRPVGGQKDIQVDVRVIGASNKTLAQLVKRGDFREDLFYRLHVVNIALPPLRQRKDDIPLLVDHFLCAIAARMNAPKPEITKEALRQLIDHAWPGNVRQLEHALMNAVVLSEGRVLDSDDFTLESPLHQVGSTAPGPPPVADRQARQREEIVAALERAGWNKTRAAEALGMPRRTFYRRLNALGIK